MVATTRERREQHTHTHEDPVAAGTGRLSCRDPPCTVRWQAPNEPPAARTSPARWIFCSSASQARRGRVAGARDLMAPSAGTRVEARSGGELSNDRLETTPQHCLRLRSPMQCVHRKIHACSTLQAPAPLMPPVTLGALSPRHTSQPPGESRGSCCRESIGGTDDWLCACLLQGCCASALSANAQRQST